LTTDGLQERRREHATDETGLSRAGDTTDAGETSEWDLAIHIFDIVDRCTPNGDLRLIEANPQRIAKWGVRSFKAPSARTRICDLTAWGTGARTNFYEPVGRIPKALTMLVEDNSVLAAQALKSEPQSRQVRFMESACWLIQQQAQTTLPRVEHAS
jgi:hypothetical protein